MSPQHRHCRRSVAALTASSHRRCELATSTVGSSVRPPNAAAVAVDRGLVAPTPPPRVWVVVIDDAQLVGIPWYFFCFVTW